MDLGVCSTYCQNKAVVIYQSSQHSLFKNPKVKYQHNFAKLTTVFNVADYFVVMNLSNGLLIVVFHIGNASTDVFQTMFLLYKEILKRRKNYHGYVSKKRS